jgi:hypothetical protein
LSKLRRSQLLAYIFLTVTFFYWKSNVIKLNDAIEKAEAKCKKIQQRIFTGLGLIIRSAESSKKGLTHLTLKRNDFFGSLFVPHPF